MKEHVAIYITINSHLDENDQILSIVISSHRYFFPIIFFIIKKITINKFFNNYLK